MPSYPDLHNLIASLPITPVSWCNYINSYLPQSSSFEKLHSLPLMIWYFGLLNVIYKFLNISFHHDGGHYHYTILTQLLCVLPSSTLTIDRKGGAGRISFEMYVCARRHPSPYHRWSQLRAPGRGCFRVIYMWLPRPSLSSFPGVKHLFFVGVCFCDNMSDPFFSAPKVQIRSVFSPSRRMSKGFFFFASVPIHHPFLLAVPVSSFCSKYVQGRNYALWM